MHLEMGQLFYLNRYIKNIGRSGNVRRSPTSTGYEKRGTEEVNQTALISFMKRQRSRLGPDSENP